MYETWIEEGVYGAARADRQEPADAGVLRGIGRIVDDRQEDPSATKQRSLASKSFEEVGNDKISTAVSFGKIDAARGTRGETLTQKEVMGGISATKVKFPTYIKAHGAG